MSALLSIVLPVFLVIGAGFVAARLRYFSNTVIDGVMAFTQNFAIPCLLFVAAMSLDFGAVFDPQLLLSYYIGCTTTFVLGILGARLIFKKRPGESVAIGFGALFANSVILGISIVDRAFGAEALAATFAIVSIHAPFCYILGTVTMEAFRADGRALGETVKAIGASLVRNPLLIGLGLGFATNFSGIPLPREVLQALDMIVAAALPTALFALGGILHRYRLQDGLGPTLMISVLSLVVQPSLSYALAVWVFDLPDAFVQAVVLTAAMAPGVNIYVFASLYKRAEGIAANTVLLGTAASVLTVSVWLEILGA